MLIDQLVDSCTEAYNESNAGDCGAECNNRDNCVGTCNGRDGCLDQVHYWPSKGGRSDYECEKLLYCYVHRFSQRYCDKILAVAQNINLAQYPRYDIFSIGCGATPDLMAFEQIAGRKEIYYEGYDKNERWEEIHNFIRDYAADRINVEVEIQPRDIFDVFADGLPANHSFNIVVIQFLISHLYNTDQDERINELYDGVINNIINGREWDSPFLIIINDVDSMNKGRNTFHRLISKLEAAGYSGHAYAKSFFETGDLGRDRWGIDYFHRNGVIDYTYEKCESEHTGAQLVIELR